MQTVEIAANIIEMETDTFYCVQKFVTHILHINLISQILQISSYFFMGKFCFPKMCDFLII